MLADNTLPFTFDLLAILKVAFLIAIGLYGVFGLVLIKQVRIMTDTIEIALEGTIKFISYLHLLAIIAVFIFAVIIL